MILDYRQEFPPEGDYPPARPCMICGVSVFGRRDRYDKKARDYYWCERCQDIKASQPLLFKWICDVIETQLKKAVDSTIKEPE